MAAPASTVWGSAVNNKGKIGIYTAVSTSDTQVSVTVQVWIATRYSAYDSNNKFYYDHGTAVTAAATSQGSISFNHSVNSSWSDSNQTKIYETTTPYVHNRGTSAQTYKIYAKLSGVDWVDGTMYVNSSYTVPALKTYTVGYDAKGGKGEPGDQIKYHGTTLTLSAQTPSRPGYMFRYWLSSAQNQEYHPGAFYGHNESTTMQAQWMPYTYPVTYDANGGTGAPDSEAKVQDQPLTLSAVVPTRTNYKFLGWGRTKTATTAAYRPSDIFAENTALTLYAVWELAYTPPTINELSIYRCNANGNADDYGTAAKIVFTWAVDTRQTDNAGMFIYVYYKTSSEASFPGSPQSIQNISGTSGTYNSTLFSGNLSTDISYDIQIIVTDKKGATTIIKTIGSVKYAIDFLAGGKGVAFNKPATKKDAADFDFDIWANKELYDKFGLAIKNGLASYGSGDAAIDPDTTTEHLCLTNKNTPMGSSYFMYILTMFYNTKSSTAARTQIAFPYNRVGSVYHRYYLSGTWSEWRRHVNEDEGIVTKDMFVYSNGTLNINM